jgi:trehalose 6-phosphate synthase/phosphatase
MNLVAKEYVASRAKQDGVLILSELAGAANELGEAIQVNPLDEQHVAMAINTALEMPLGEQIQRMTHMQKRLLAYNVVNWVDDFFRQLINVKENQISQATKYLTDAHIQQLKHAYGEAKSRLLLLDYDGTLTGFSKNPAEATPSRELIDLLKSLTADPKNHVVIISGRNSNFLEEWFGELDMELVAEHGASTKQRGSSWIHAGNTDHQWKDLIRPTLELFDKRSPGSFTEEKKHTLAWHYRQVDIDLGFIRSRELLDSLFHLVRNGQLNVIDGNKVIEVRQAGIDKGTSARKISEFINAEFVLIIGDDKTDEDMFKAISDNATTIRVGSVLTAAKYNVGHQTEVLKLLRQLDN